MGLSQKMQPLGSLFVDLDPLNRHEVVQKINMMDEDEFIAEMILGITDEEEL